MKFAGLIFRALGELLLQEKNHAHDEYFDVDFSYLKQNYELPFRQVEQGVWTVRGISPFILTFNNKSNRWKFSYLEILGEECDTKEEAIIDLLEKLRISNDGLKSFEENFLNDNYNLDEQ